MVHGLLCKAVTPCGRLLSTVIRPSMVVLTGLRLLERLFSSLPETRPPLFFSACPLFPRRRSLLETGRTNSRGGGGGPGSTEVPSPPCRSTPSVKEGEWRSGWICSSGLVWLPSLARFLTTRSSKVWLIFVGVVPCRLSFPVWVAIESTEEALTGARVWGGWLDWVGGSSMGC